VTVMCDVYILKILWRGGPLDPRFFGKHAPLALSHLIWCYPVYMLHRTVLNDPKSLAPPCVYIYPDSVTSQACGMFIGEFLCFLVYWIWRHFSEEGRDAVTIPVSKWFLFIVPAMCDLVSTSSLYIALNLTYASSFQMLRGKGLA